MKTSYLAQVLLKVINKHRFIKRYTNEFDLEREVYELLRETLRIKFHLDDNKLDEMIIAHGKSKEEKSSWTKIKARQRVIIEGCGNTSDIVIRLQNDQIIAINIKYAKEGFTTAIQTTIGQCLIASVRHIAAIGVVFIKRKGNNEYDKSRVLSRRLKNQNIFFLVKSLHHPSV